MAVVSAELIDITAQPAVPAAYLTLLERLGREAGVVFAKVEESRAGLLYLDNVLGCGRCRRVTTASGRGQVTRGWTAWTCAARRWRFRARRS